LVNGAPATQTFTGVVTDDICAKGGHDAMQMGPTDAECTTACVGIHGATYVLLARGKMIYLLSDQKAPERFAGQKVTVKGVLDPKTNRIQVASIAASKKPRGAARRHPSTCRSPSAPRVPSADAPATTS